MTERQIRIDAIARRLLASDIDGTNIFFDALVFDAERAAYGRVPLRSDHQARLFRGAVRARLSELRFNSVVATVRAAHGLDTVSQEG